VAAAILYSNYLIFLVVPNERLMGPVQRIFYFHVGSAIAGYCASGVMLIAALAYLATRDRRADVVMEAGAEAGLVFSTIVMATGMIWGHSAWNTWFRFEPRLVTFLLLWLIFVSFKVLRYFGDPARIPLHSSVLGILGALTVPLVVFSIHLLPQSQQLHPQVVGNRGLAPEFQYAMFVAMASIIALTFLLIWLRTRIGFLELQKELR
jgi:heme exporter protein C